MPALRVHLVRADDHALEVPGGILSRRPRKTGISFFFVAFTGSWAAVVPSSRRPDKSIGAVPPRAGPRSAISSTRR
ncbi:MAG TPA: hypothetical protein VF070_48760 [Streptosporangiaceae bacterium]